MVSVTIAMGRSYPLTSRNANPRALKALTQMADPQRQIPFQVLIEAHARPVAAFLRGMLPADEVDDVLQETMVAALRAYPGFDGANPRAWLLTIARRKAIDEHRSRSRRPEPLVQPDQVPAAAAESDGHDPELWGRVAALPPKQRAAVVLRFALDLRYREVGESLGCSEDAARRSVHEAMRTLRSPAPESPTRR
jgi:RNA polymerase sigma factor (sigma-70 family)